VPAAALVSVVLPGSRRNLIVPAGILAYTFGMTSIYVFSTSPNPLDHMDTAYERTLMVAVLSGILYSAATLLSAISQGPESRAGRQLAAAEGGLTEPALSISSR
jgi:hypothetical protein